MDALIELTGDIGSALATSMSALVGLITWLSVPLAVLIAVVVIRRRRRRGGSRDPGAGR